MALNFNDFVQQYFGGGNFGFNGSVGQNYGQFNQPSGQYNVQPTYGGQYNAGGHSPLGGHPTTGGIYGSSQYGGMPSGGLPQFPPMGGGQQGALYGGGGFQRPAGAPQRSGPGMIPGNTGQWGGGILNSGHLNNQMQSLMSAYAQHLKPPAPGWANGGNVIHGAPVRAF